MSRIELPPSLQVTPELIREHLAEHTVLCQHCAHPMRGLRLKA